MNRKTPLKRTPFRPRTRVRPGWRAAKKTVRERSGGQCEVVIDGWQCPDRSDHVHHIVRRGQGGGDDPANLLDVCRVHHGEIHDDPAWARALGFLRSPWGSV